MTAQAGCESNSKRWLNWQRVQANSISSLIDCSRWLASERAHAVRAHASRSKQPSVSVRRGSKNAQHNTFTLSLAHSSLKTRSNFSQFHPLPLDRSFTVSLCHGAKADTADWLDWFFASIFLSLSPHMAWMGWRLNIMDERAKMLLNRAAKAASGREKLCSTHWWKLYVLKTSLKLFSLRFTYDFQLRFSCCLSWALRASLAFLSLSSQLH